jgi:hypothetical protein
MKVTAQFTPLDFVVRFPNGGTQDRHGEWTPRTEEVEFDVSDGKPDKVKLEAVNLSGLKVVSTQFRHRIGGHFVKALYSKRFTEVSEVVIMSTFKNEVHIYLIIPQ